MSLEIWLAFIAASAILLIIPGPTIILVVAQSLSHGRQATAWLVGGVMLGDFTAMTLSLTGLGALLTASSMLFTIMRWLGGLYLIWLGVSLWRNKETGVVEAAPSEESGPALLRSAFIVTALNPKSLLFFFSFLPQFISPEESFRSQALLLIVSFVVLAGINAAIYSILAGKSDRAWARPLFRRVGGGTLAALGLTALWSARN
jgi:threonine/homoserine/homoserine lactone efflux protein